jgi:hypothetical protein
MTPPVATTTTVATTRIWTTARPPTGVTTAADLTSYALYIQLNVIASIVVIFPFSVTVLLCLYQLRQRCILRNAARGAGASSTSVCARLFRSAGRRDSLGVDNDGRATTPMPPTRDAEIGNRSDVIATPAVTAVLMEAPPSYEEALSMPRSLSGQMVLFYAGNTSNCPEATAAGGILQCAFTMTADSSGECKPPTYIGFVSSPLVNRPPTPPPPLAPAVVIGETMIPSSDEVDGVGMESQIVDNGGGPVVGSAPATSADVIAGEMTSSERADEDGKVGSASRTMAERCGESVHNFDNLDVETSFEMLSARCYNDDEPTAGSSLDNIRLDVDDTTRI